MQIRPFAELEEMSRARYRARYAKASPEPRVINADAEIQFTAPRRFKEGGIGFRAPPLSYPVGVRLLVAANALRDILRADPPAPPAFLETAIDTAVYLIGQAIQPTNRLRRMRGRWLRVFRKLEPQRLEQFLRYLLHVPDASPSIPGSGKPVTLDMTDQRLAVTRAWPGCVDPKTGLPRLWADYVLGTRHLSRVRARDEMQLATAFRVAQGADKQAWTEWLNEGREAAGWHG